MATIRHFEQLEAWQAARSLTRAVHSSSRKFLRSSALRNQIQRASLSIMANVAEGFEASGDGEFSRFLAIARASASEVESHLFVARDLGYLTEHEFAALREQAIAARKKIAGLIIYLRRRAEQKPNQTRR